MKTIFAILLMCFTSFAFAEGDVMEGSKKAREEGSVPDTSIYGEEGGMAPPVDGPLPEGGGPKKAGLPPAGGDVEEGEHHRETELNLLPGVDHDDISEESVEG